MWSWGGQETPQTRETDTGQPNAVVDLSDQLQQQQQLITHLKDMVRSNENALQVKEKELEENASKLSKIKLQHKAKVSQLSNQLQEAQKKLTASSVSLLPGGTTVKPDEEDDASSEGSHASHTEQSSRGRLLLLKKKLEESRSAFEKREHEVHKRNQDIEEVVGNLRKQLHERDETITKLQTRTTVESSEVTSSSDQDKNNSGSQQMYAQIVYKDTKILELNNRILELEAKVMDLQENVRDKNEVIQSRNKAIQLMAEDLSRKGKATVDQLDDTKEEMRQMQQTFVTMESCWKEERERLIGELETSKEKYVFDAAEKEHRICDLKETVTKLEAARFDLSARNAALQEKVVTLQETFEKIRRSKPRSEDTEKLSKDVKDLQSRLEEKEQQIRDFQSALESDKSSGGKSVVKLKAQYVSKIKALEKQLAEAKSSGKELHQFQQQIAELEDEKGNLQLKLVDFDDVKAAEVKHQEIINELRTKLSQQSDDLTNHVRMVSLLQQEKMDFAESLAKARQEIASFTEQQSALHDAKVALEMKVVELEESRDGLEERSQALIQEIERLKQNLENEKRPVMAIEDEKDALQIKLDEITTMLHDKESRILQLEQELAIATKEKADLEHRVHQVEKDLSSVEEQILTKEAAFNQIFEKQKTVEDLISVFCEQHDILEPTIDQLNSKWADMMSVQQHLQNEVSQFCQRHNVGTLAELEIAWIELRQNEAFLQEEVKKHEKDVLYAQEQLGQLQNTFEEFKLKSKAEKEELNITITTLTETNKILGVSAAEKNSQMELNVKEFQEVTAAVALLEERVSELKSQLEATNDEKTYLSDLLHENIMQNKHFQIIISTKDKDLDDVRNLLIQNETRLESITAELQSKTETLTNFQSSVSELEGKLELQVTANDKLHQQMDAANQSLMEQLSDMELEVTRLQNDVAEKGCIIETLQEERNHLHKTTEGLAQDLSMRKEEMQTVILQKDTDISHLQEQIQELNEVNKTAQDRELQWQADSDAKLKNIESLTLDLERAEQTYKDVVKRLELSSADMGSMQQLLEERNIGLARLQDEVLELKSRLQEVKEGLSDKEQLRAKLEVELCEQVRSGEAAANAIEQLQKKSKQDAQSIEELSEAKLQLENNIETSSHVITDLQKGIEELEASNRFLKEQLDMKGKDSEEQVFSLQQAHQRLEDLIHQKSTELQQLNSELHDLSSIIRQLKNENSEQEKAITSLQKSLDVQLSENQQLNSQVTSLNQQLSENARQSDQLRSVVGEVESCSQLLQQEKQLLEQQIVEFQQVITISKHESSIAEEKLTQSVSTLSSSKSELVKELEEYKDKCVRLQVDLDVITEQFSVAVAKSTETEAAFSSIQLEVASANDTMASQLSELHEYSLRLTDAEKRSAELEEELRMSVNQVTSFTGRLQAAENEATKHHAEYSKLEQEYKCKFDELENEKSHSALIRKELSEMAEAKHYLNQQIEESSLKILHLTTGLQESTELNEQLKSQVSSLHAEYEDFKLNSSQQIYALSSNTENVEQHYKSLTESENTDKKEYITKLKHMEDENAELVGRASSLAQQLEQAQLQLIEQDRLTRHLEAEAENMAQLQDTLKVIQDHNAVLQQKQKELELARNTLQVKNANLQNAVTQASERNEKMSLYTEQLEADLQSIQESWENANQEKIQLHEELVAVKSSLASEIEQNQILHGRLGSLQEEQKELIDQTSHHHKETEAQLELLTKDNKEKQIKIESLMNEAEVRMSAIMSLQDNCQKNQSLTEQLENDLALVRKEMKNKQQEVESFNQMVAALKEEVGVKQSKIEITLRTVDELQGALAFKDSVIEGLQRDSTAQADLLSHSKQEISMKQDEILRLENDVQTYTQNILRMQTTLNNIMESEGNKEDDRKKLVNQLNQMEMTLSQERTERHTLEMNLADLAQVREDLGKVATQLTHSLQTLDEQTLALDKVQLEKDTLEKLLLETQQQSERVYSESVKERETLVYDREQMRLYIDEQIRLIDTAQKENSTLEELIRKLGESLNLAYDCKSEEIIENVKQHITSLEEKIPVLEQSKREGYLMLNEMVELIVGSDAHEVSIQAAKSSVVDWNSRFETLSALLEETNTTVTQLKQEVAMLQHDKQNLIEANNQLAERQALIERNTPGNNQDVVDSDALDFVRICLEEEPMLNQDAAQQNYQSITIGRSASILEKNVDALQQENMLLKDEISALKVQLSQLIDTQEQSGFQKADSWGESLKQGQNATSQHGHQGMDPISSVDYQLQLRVILDLIRHEENRPVSFQEAKQALEAHYIKLEELTSSILDSEIIINRLQDELDRLQNENQKLGQINASINKQHSVEAPAKEDRGFIENATIECIQDLEGDWVTGEDEHCVTIDTVTNSEVNSTNSIQVGSTINQVEIDAVVQENILLKEEIEMLKLKLSEIVDSAEVNVVKRIEMVGVNPSTHAEDMQHSNFDISDIIKLIYGCDKDDVSLDEVRCSLLQKEAHLKQMETYLLEANVKINNLQLEIQALNQNKKEIISQMAQNSNLEISYSDKVDSIEANLNSPESFPVVDSAVQNAACGIPLTLLGEMDPRENDTLLQENMTLKGICHLKEHNDAAVMNPIESLGTRPKEMEHLTNFHVIDIVKLIFAKVPENVSLEHVKSVLAQKDEELENVSTSLLEAEVKISNLQLIIQNLQEEKKEVLEQQCKKLNNSKKATCKDDSITAVLQMLEADTSSERSSNPLSTNSSSSENTSELDRVDKECDLLKENLALKDEISTLRIKLVEMVEKNEVTVMKHVDMLGKFPQETEFLTVTELESVLNLIFNDNTRNSNLDDIKRVLKQKNDHLDELSTMLLEAEVKISNLQLEVEALNLEQTKVNQHGEGKKSFELAESVSKDSHKEDLKKFEEQWADQRFEKSSNIDIVGFGGKEHFIGGCSISKEAFDALTKENHNLRAQVTDLQKRLCLIVEKTESATAQHVSLLGSVESDETSSVSLAAEPTISSVDSDILSISPARENLSALELSADSHVVELMDEIERLKELNEALEVKCRIAEENFDKCNENEERLALLSAELNSAVQEKEGCSWAIDELKEENDELVTRIQEANKEIKRLQQMLKDEQNQWEVERLDLFNKAKLVQPITVTEQRVTNEKLQTTDYSVVAANHAKATEELGLLKVKNGKMLAKLKQFKDKNDHLQKMLDAATACKAQTTDSLDLHSTIAVLSREKADIELSLTASINENNLLKSELNRLKGRSDIVNLSTTSVDENNQFHQNLFAAGTQEENNELKHRIEELLETNHMLTQENEKLKRMTTDANERSDALLSDNSTFQILVENSKTAKSKLELELKNQMTLLFHANEENKKLIKNIEGLEVSVAHYKDLDEKYQKLERDWQATKSALTKTEINVVEARHKLQQLQRENEALRKDKVELELKLNSEVSEQDQIDAYTKEINKLTEKFNNAQQNNSQLLSDSTAMREQISVYREEIEDLRTNVASLEQMLIAYKDQVEEKEKVPPNVNIIDENRQFAPTKLESNFSDEAYLHEQLELAGIDRVKLQQSVDTFTASAQEMKAELERNISEKNSLLYKLEGWRDQSEKLNAENEELRKRYRRLENMSEQLETEKQLLMQQLHQMKGELEQAQWLCQRQSEEVATLKAVTEKQNYDLKNLSQQNESLLLSIQQMTAEKQSLEATSSSLQQEVSRLKSSNDSLIQQSDNWRKHLNSISSNLTLPDANAPSESEAKTTELSLAHLQAELHQTMQSLHRRDQRCEELSEELAALLEERDDLQLRLSALVRNQYNKDIQMQQLQRRLEDQEERAHSVTSPTVSYHSNLEKVELGLELDDQQPLMLPATSYTLTRTVASTSWRIRNWMQGRRNYLHRTWKSRSSLKLLYYTYILCLHVLVLFCAFER